MKTYVVADIHGRCDLLIKALDAIQDDSPVGGTFICLGDFIDRGPDSRQVLELLKRGLTDQWKWIVLQGNHEDIMLQALEDERLLGWWFRNGGYATVESYPPIHDSVAIPNEHVEWLKGLPTLHEDKHRIYVHAGLPSDAPVDKVDKQTRQWMLYKQDQDRLYSDAAYFDGTRRHCSGKHIVHGHHQGEDHPLLHKHRTNLDGWAWYTGRLHIGVFDDDTPGGPEKILTVEGERYEPL